MKIWLKSTHGEVSINDVPGRQTHDGRQPHGEDQVLAPVQGGWGKQFYSNNFHHKIPSSQKLANLKINFTNNL